MDGGAQVWAESHGILDVANLEMRKTAWALNEIHKIVERTIHSQAVRYLVVVLSTTFLFLSGAPKSPPITNKYLVALSDRLAFPTLPLLEDPDSHAPLFPPLVPYLLELRIRLVCDPSIIIDESRLIAPFVGVDSNTVLAIKTQVVVRVCMRVNICGGCRRY